MTTPTVPNAEPAKDLGIGPITQVAPGIYTDESDEHVLVLVLSEVVTHLGLEDTQECRASIYGGWVSICEPHGIELILVREEDVPSLRAPQS